MKIDVLTLFPDMFKVILDNSIIKRAISSNKVSINLVNIRDFSTLSNNQVDDTPYGGGGGMVLMCEPVFSALIILCGHYEGFDERIKTLVDEEISIGDFVLTGGEIPAMSIIDSVTRLVPGVISEESLTSESFTDNLLDYPVYTKPQVFRGMKVPDVLISGDHKKIEEYRYSERVRLTKEKRPDLLK